MHEVFIDLNTELRHSTVPPKDTDELDVYRFPQSSKSTLSIAGSLSPQTTVKRRTMHPLTS